jgi:hypothetical protein
LQLQNIKIKHGNYETISPNDKKGFGFFFNKFEGLSPIFLAKNSVF